ncbi:MAG: hypothetical protein P8M03_04710 [Flavobacteriaceae bacterium]|nr:hypothetical protein [Flavobacteriaceae bacterium]
MKKIILSILVVIGFSLTALSFSNNELLANYITIKNYSSKDYEVCIYCNSIKEGAAKLLINSVVKSMEEEDFKVRCEMINLEVKYGDFSCDIIAFSDSYTYILN